MDEPNDFTMRTAFGEQPLSEDTLPGWIESARDQEDSFVILERTSDGAFVQYNGAQLEFGRDGKLQRFDTTIAVRAAFERFRAGEDPADDEAWVDVTAELKEEAAARRRSWIYAALILPLVAAVIGIVYWIATR